MSFIPSLAAAVLLLSGEKCCKKSTFASLTSFRLFSCLLLWIAASFCCLFSLDLILGGMTRHPSKRNQLYLTHAYPKELSFNGIGLAELRYAVIKYVA